MLTAVRTPRAVLPGDNGDRPDLYDAETNEYIGTAASWPHARMICGQLWRQSSAQPLAAGEQAVAPELVKKLDALLEPHLDGCRVMPGDACDCAAIIANREAEKTITAATDGSYEAVSARPETPGDMAEQVRWLTRRIADDQHELDTVLDRLVALASNR